MASSVISLIPIYKSIPSEAEWAAMCQCRKILGAHELKILGPKSLDYGYYLDNNWPAKDIITLDDRHFRNIDSYNNMLCSRWFYQSFQTYTYLFIIQNDAWVFSDQLLAWCQKDYDYVGAPWLWEPENNGKKPIINLWPLFKNEIGNGGVSLRKVETFIKYAWVAKLLFSITRKNEDFIWLMVDRMLGRPMKKPTIQEAMSFCIEMEPALSMKMIDNQLPFCTHAYERYGSIFWKEFINK